MSGDKILEKRMGSKVPAGRPQISVILPAYNCTEFIQETLDSALAQTYQDYEIILVNDGSTDTEKLESILENYFERLIYVRQKNGGPAAARNTAIELARGRYLAFLDSDDIWLPDYLETQVAAITGENADMIYSDALLFGMVQREDESYMVRCPSNGKVTTESLLSNECNVITSGTMVLREKVLEAGMFNEDPALIAIEDFDLWFRMVKLGAKIEYQKKILLKYRVRATSLSGNNIQRGARSIQNLKLLRENYELSGSESERLNKSLRLAVARLQFEIGKYHLLQEEFSLARENFREANKYYQKFKYSVLEFLLRVYPQLVLRFFKKTYPVEVAFLKPDLADGSGGIYHEAERSTRLAQK
jgi:glycosyltransferase involved in cell wall biosynthesis